MLDARLAAPAARNDPPSRDDARAARATTSTRLSARDALLLVAILGLATVLRLHDLGTGGIWLDEGYSLLQTEFTVGEIVARRAYDANPPLYLLLLRVWRTAFGDGVLAARLLSVVCGVAGVALVFAVTRLRFGIVAAGVAGALVAVSRVHVHYSQEIRGYTLLFAAVAATDLLFVRWEARGRTRDLVGWAIAGFVAIAVHTFAWWILASHALLAARRRRTLLALGAIVVASLPLWWTLFEHLTTFQSQSWIPPADLDALTQVLWVLGGCGRIALLVWALAALGAAAHLTPRLPSWLTRAAALPGWRTAAVPSAQLLLPFVVFVVSLLAIPMLVERYLLLSLLALAGLAGAGVAALEMRVARVAVVAALAVLSVPPLVEQSAQVARTGISSELSALLRDEYRPGDVVVYTSKHDFAPFVATHPPEMEEYLLFEPAGDERSTVLAHYCKRETRRAVPARGEYRRLWLVRRAADRPEDVVASDWFRALTPKLAWQHPSGLLLRFDLPPS